MHRLALAFTLLFSPSLYQSVYAEAKVEAKAETTADSAIESAVPCKKGDGSKSFSHSPHLQKELNLSEKQREQVKAVQADFTGLVETKTQNMKVLNEELIAQLQSPEKGLQAKAALLEKFKKYQAARNELYLTRFEMALKIRELLSEEQIKKYKAFYKPDGGKHSK